MRELYYVPIMHTPEELGPLAKPFLEMEKRIHGPRAEEIYREKVNQYWREVVKRLKAEGLNSPEKCKSLHIYVDGLPRVESELVQKLVEKLIELKLPLYLIIQELLEKGATIHGTESHELLLEERNMWVNVAKGKSADPKRKMELLKERDVFIARRINESLPENGKGILFIGREHKVIEELEKLPSKFKVIYL